MSKCSGAATQRNADLRVGEIQTHVRECDYNDIRGVEIAQGSTQAQDCLF
jgi:hypothetical protein